MEFPMLIIDLFLKGHYVISSELYWESLMVGEALFSRDETP